MPSAAYLAYDLRLFGLVDAEWRLTALARDHVMPALVHVPAMPGKACIARPEQEKPRPRARRGRGSATAAATESAKPAHGDTPTNVISASEAAALLGIHRTTLYEIAKRGEIPCRRIGRRFIFVRETLIEWMRCSATPHGPTMPGTE